MKKWQLFAVLEGTSKTVSGVFQDFVGRAMASIELGCIAAMMLGITQAAGGFLGFFRRVISEYETEGRVISASAQAGGELWYFVELGKVDEKIKLTGWFPAKSLRIEGEGGALGLSDNVLEGQKVRARHQFWMLIPNKAILWAIAFGFMAAIPGTVISLYTFTLGAEFSARTLLISASIIPGAILGRYVWGSVTDPLGLRQWIGIGLFLFACWAILDFPTDFGFEPWVWWTLIITFTQPVNEFLSRKAADAKLDPWTNNFWVGTSTVFWTFIAFVVMTSITGPGIYTVDSSLAIGSLLLGVIVTGMISFKLLSYAGGGTIALKKVIMQGTYLITFTVVGLMYGQPFTRGDITGLLVFFPAFAFIDKDTWKGMKSLIGIRS